uniref:Uncharacterized protein n=1 Tax=Tanacetum cinerariifolium TaxID=118510 RepID=A0A6L2JNG0_TANCI|nr:hypothetical protein [Tanacetum cinerariifolium]
MNTPAQQTALDNALVSLGDRVKIGKCNMRIILGKMQKEPTYQVVLDALALSPLYLAFLIIAETSHAHSPRWHSLGFLEILSKTEEYQAYGALILEEMNNQQMYDSPTYKTYHAFTIGAVTPKKARKFKKLASPSKKKTLVVVEEPAKKPAARRQSAGGSSDGANVESEVPDEPKGNDDDDDQQGDDERTESDNNKAIDLNKTYDEKGDGFVHTPDDYVPTNDENVDDKEYDRINEEMYSDVNVKLKDTELEEEEKDDEEMTDAGHVDDEHENVNQEIAGDQVKDDALEITLRNVNHSLAIRTTIKYEVPTVVKELLGTNLDDTLEKVIKKQLAAFIQEHSASATVVADAINKQLDS